LPTVGVIVHDTADPVHPPILRRIEARLREVGYLVVVGNAGYTLRARPVIRKDVGPHGERSNSRDDAPQLTGGRRLRRSEPLICITRPCLYWITQSPDPLDFTINHITRLAIAGRSDEARRRLPLSAEVDVD